MFSPWHRAGQHLGQQQALLADGSLQLGIFRWIDIVNAAGNDRRCPPLRCGFMGRRVDAARQSRYNEE